MKKDDTVVCIKNIFYEDELIIGKRYTIDHTYTAFFENKPIELLYLREYPKLFSKINFQTLDKNRINKLNQIIKKWL